MTEKPLPQLQDDLEHRIQARTGRRVRELAIEVRPGCVILHGHTSSYYVKQLAQQSVREVLPHIYLENSISVVNNAILVG